MFLFSFKKRALHLESLESRELMSVSPLTPGVFAQQQPVQSASGVAAESATVYPAPAVSDIKASGMMLTWDVSDFDHLRTDEPFKIEKASTVSGTKIWTQLGSDILYSYTAGKTEYSYQISGLEAATEYEFRVSFGSTKYGRAYTESVTVSTLQSELTAEALTSESVKLSWTIAAKSGTYFSVQKKDGSNWIEAGKYKAENTTAALRNFTVDDLEAGTDYEFKLVYYQPVSTGVQTETQTVTVKTLYTLTEANAETTNVELMYPPAVTGTGFIVQVCSGTSSPAQETNWTNAKINSAAAVANGFKVIGLKENTSYYFRVKYNVVVDGLTQTRYTDVLNYSSPTSITLSNATEKSIRVSWTFESKTGTANYIEISKTGNGADWIDSANTTATATTLNNLDAGTKYYIRVRYTSKAGVVSYSAVSTEETGVAAVLDSVSNNSASISWDIPGIANGTAVAVQRCDGSLDPDADTNWRTVENNCTTNSFTAEHLASNKKYYFRVQYELNGETKHTIYVDALTAGTLSAGETTIDTVKLDWNFVPKTSSTVTVQYFIGQSAPTSEAQWKPQPLTEADLDADRLGCTVKELTPGQKYFFRVIYTPEGSTVQQKSTVASATTQGEIFVAKEVNDTSITLHWAAAGFGAKKQENKNYIIYCWEESDRPNAKTWQVSEAISASANQYTFSGLLADTEYQFKIAYAGDTAANAVNSSPLVVETTPHRIDYTSTKNSIRLDWDFETFQHAGNNESQNGDGNGKFLVQ
ncbi:MAG: fibronectin type III domain-containing protein, partial [Planctomycetaceae bacterium]|nr:fibronectin type III domain-containing protein [Planctomycetaceae bacterium]